MKWHRRRIDALNRTISTERFDLVPVGKSRALQLYRRMTEDPEVLLQLSHSDKKPSLWRLIRKYPYPNGRSRFMHEVLVRETGDSIGYHEIHLMHYLSAMLGVVIQDRSWWGKSVPLEARRAILAHFAKHAGVERFCGSVEARNFASILNYKKLGFRHSGTMHRCEFDIKNKVPLDYLHFELLKEDFPSYFNEGQA